MFCLRRCSESSPHGKTLGLSIATIFALSDARANSTSVSPYREPISRTDLVHFASDKSLKNSSRWCGMYFECLSADIHDEHSVRSFHHWSHFPFLAMTRLNRPAG